MNTTSNRNGEHLPVVRLTNHDIQRIAKAVGSEIGKQVIAAMRKDVEPSSISSDENSRPPHGERAFERAY